MLYELVDMSEWRIKSDILSELKSKGIFFDERGFRKAVEAHNKLYFEHQSKYYIAHSSRGYKATTDEVEIIKSAEDYKVRALDMLVKYSKSLKAMGENAHLNLIIKDDEIYVMEL